VSFRREAVRIVSSCVRAGYRRVTAKVATGVARVTLACAMGVVVVVVTVTTCRNRGALVALRPVPRPQETP
jgi:hypothetical protein